MSAQILLFTGVQQSKSAPKTAPVQAPRHSLVPAVIPQFLAGQAVWVIDYEADRRVMGSVFRQSGEWVQVRLKGHNPISAHVSVIEVVEPEVA